METPLHGLRENLTAAVDALPWAILLVDPSGVVAARNRAALQFLPDGDTLNEIFSGVEGAEHPGRWLDALGDAPEASLRVARLAMRRGSASRLLDLELTRLPAPPGMALLTASDASAVAAMERRAATTERLAAVGRIAAQVAHELNTPLDGVQRYVGLAQRVLGQPDKAAKYLDQARAGLERMASIIAELLDASRAGATQEAVPVGALLQQAGDAMDPLLQASGVSLACDMAHPADGLAPANVFQVFCNLIKNAIDAMPRGGLLQVRSRRQGDRVVITFADGGEGIPEEMLERIFEPFFTTRTGSRRGTGLGLSICRELLGRCGGAIHASRRPQGGAEFTVAIPYRTARVAHTAGQAEPEGSA